MEFQITSEVEKFNAVCQIVRQQIFIGLIMGEPGVGKTYAAMQYAKENKNTTYICLDILSRKIGTLIKQLAEALNICDYWQIHKILKIITCRLNSYNFLLIDECDYLSDDCLDLIRGIYDKSRCPILFIGSPYFIGRIQGKKFLQLRSRMHSEIMDRLTLMELQKILSDVDIRNVKIIYKKTEGNFRKLSRLLNEINRLAEINNLPKTNKDIIEEASRNLRVG